MNEKVISKGHHCMTLVCDLHMASVDYLGEKLNEASLSAYFDAFPEDLRAQIDVTGMDTRSVYINACLDNVRGEDPNMVIDRFHIMRHIVDAVDKVRKQEHRVLQEGSESGRLGECTCG